MAGSACDTCFHTPCCEETLSTLGGGPRRVRHQPRHVAREAEAQQRHRAERQQRGECRLGTAAMSCGSCGGGVRGVCDEIFDEYRSRGREGAGEVGGDVAPLPGWN